MWLMIGYRRDGSKLVGTGAHYSFTVRRDEEEKLFVPVVTSIIHGITRKVTLTLELFKSNEYREFCRLGATLKGLFEAGAYVKREDTVRGFKRGRARFRQEGIPLSLLRCSVILHSP